MPKDRRSGKKIQKIAGNHQKCWLWGRHVVTEAVRAGRWLPTRIILDEELSEAEKHSFGELCNKRDISVEYKTSARLKQLCKSSEHQGYLARMPEFSYEKFEQSLSKLKEPLILILDRLQDPFNFGAMLRSAEVLGADAVLIGTQEQVGVTTAVARSSAGAVNYLPVMQVENLSQAVMKLREIDFKVIGTSLEESQSLSETDLTGPVAIVIGNESRGVAAELLELCTDRIKIPQQGRLDSLNAAVATGVIMYEASLQRNS